MNDKEYLKSYTDFMELIQEINQIQVNVYDEILMVQLIDKLEKLSHLWIDFYNSNYDNLGTIFFKNSMFNAYELFNNCVKELKLIEGKKFRETKLLMKIIISDISIIRILYDDYYSFIIE